MKDGLWWKENKNKFQQGYETGSEMHVLWKGENESFQGVIL